MLIPILAIVGLVSSSPRQLVCDLGSVPKGPTLEMKLKITNETDAPLVVQRYGQSCTMALYDWMKLAPGESRTDVALMVETKNFSGPISKSGMIIFVPQGSGDITVECVACGPE